MIWLRRALLLVVGSLLTMVLLLTIAYATFDETDYRRGLVWVADHVFDSTLQVDGPLSLTLSRNAIFSGEDISLRANDGSFSVSGSLLSISVELSHLLSGTLWIKDIRISDLRLHINETGDGVPDWQDYRVPSIIIERAKIEQLVVEYQERSPGGLHHVALESLLLDDVNDQGPVSIQARGEFEGDTFTLTGTLPGVADVLAHDKPNPLDLVLEGKGTRFAVTGSIVDPMNGDGMDLHINLDTTDSTRLMEWLSDDVPDLGEFNMTARLLGNYEAPRLEGIDASLKRNDQDEVTITGRVEDIYTGEGLDLALMARMKRPAFVSWILFGKPDQLVSLDMKGHFQKNNKQIRVSALDADVISRSGLSFSLSGDTEIYPANHTLKKTDSSLNVTFKMPSLSALSVFGMDTMPDLGGVSGRFRLAASMDVVAVYDSDVTLSRQPTDNGRLQGDIGNIPLQANFYASNIDLQLRYKTTDIKALSTRLGIEGVGDIEIGSAEAHMRVSGNSDRLRLDQVRLQAGNTSGLQVSANGKVDRLKFVDPMQSAVADFKLSASAPDLKDLSGLAGVELPALGAVDMNGKLSLRKSTVNLENIRANIGRPDQPTIRLGGAVVTQLHKGSSIDVTYNVALADLVAAFTKRVPDYLGRLEGDASISDIDGSWGIEKFTLQSKQTDLFRIDVHGGFDDLKNSDEVDISIDFEVAEPAKLGKALDINIAGLGTYREQGQFTSNRDVISYNGNMKIGSSRGTTVINGHKHSDYPTFSGALNIPLLDLTDIGFELEHEVEYTVIASPGSGGKESLFSQTPLKVDFLNHFGLDLKLSIDEVESYGRYSLDSVNGTVKLQDGALRINPLSFVYAGGTMNMDLGLQATRPPGLSLIVRADDLLLGPAMAQVTSGEPIGGRTNVNMDITATGMSAHEMASALNGTINFEYENARVPTWLVDYLSVDLFGWVFSKTIPKQGYMTLNCVLAEFEASNGELNSKLLLADGPNLSVGGRVDLDLGNETIDAVLLPKQKKRLFSTITPVRLSGSIMSPDVLAIPVQAAVQEIGALTLSAPIYLSARFLEKIWGAIRTDKDVGKGCTEIGKMTDRAEAARQSE